MCPEQKSHYLKKAGSNDAYGSQILIFQRVAKSAHIGLSSGHVSILAQWEKMPHFSSYLRKRADFGTIKYIVKKRS